MIRQYLELPYSTLADARARGPADVSRLVTHLPGRQLAGPLSFVERQSREGEVVAVAGFELESATRLPPFDPVELLAELRAKDAAEQARSRQPITEET